MIFVLDEANGLYVLSSEAELQTAFEAVDIEDGVYRFFDDSGHPLKPEFIARDQRCKILDLIGWPRWGTYQLIAGEDGTLPHLPELLNTAVTVEPNQYFSDIDAIRRSLSR